MADLWENPMGTDGFEFIEYTAPDTQAQSVFQRASQFFSGAQLPQSVSAALIAPGRPRRLAAHAG